MRGHFAGRLSLKVTEPLALAAFRDAASLDALKLYVTTIASQHMLVRASAMRRR
jgi:hypothetical protein